MLRRLTAAALDYEDPRSLVSRLRRRRLALLEPLLRSAFERRGEVRLVDLGGSAAYWRRTGADLLERYDVEVTIVNLPGHVASGIDGRFRFVAADACDLATFSDRAFDVAHANSVVEHVGGPQQMRRFAEEVARVAGAYLVQTPSYWFPLEPHVLLPGFQWLPRSARRRLLLARGWGHVPRARDAAEAAEVVDHTELLDRARFAALFPDATIHVERLLGWPKSYVAIRAER